LGDEKEGRGEAHPSLFFDKIVEIVSSEKWGQQHSTPLNVLVAVACPLQSPNEVILYFTHRGTRQLEHMSVE
jgi:hypothetical protein